MKSLVVFRNGRCGIYRVKRRVFRGLFDGLKWTFEETQPPSRWVERAVALVERRVDVIEEVPN